MNKAVSLRIVGVALSAVAVRFVIRRYARQRAAAQGVIEG